MMVALAEGVLSQITRAGFILYLTASHLSLITPAFGQSKFERPPTLAARDLLPPALLSGPFHHVEAQVTSDGYFNNYKLKSKFGDFDIEGQQLLEIRIGELNALNELDQLSTTKVVGDGLYEGGKATVMAPVNVVKKVAQTVSDPNKMYETVKGIPEGAERVFSWAYRQAKGAVHGVSEMVSRDDKVKSDKSSDKSKSTLEAGKDLGLQFVGYSKRERELFKKLQINPYTSNQAIKDEVTRVAGVSTAVGFAFRFVPGLGLLGQLSTFNRWYGRAESLSLYEDPDVIKERNKAELVALDLSPEMIEEFQNAKAYNPWTRRFIVASMTALGPNVAGRALFIKAALSAKNEPSTLYFVSVAEQFEKINKESALKKIVASMYLPAGVTTSRILIVPLSVDYLFWTEEVSGIFSDFKERVTKEESFSSVQIRVRGRVSKRARTALERMGAKVIENSF